MTDLIKIALVTGGSRGLGRNTAENLARRGFDVILTYRSNKDEAERVVSLIEAAGRRAIALQLDTGNSVVRQLHQNTSIGVGQTRRRRHRCTRQQCRKFEWHELPECAGG